MTQYNIYLWFISFSIISSKSTHVTSNGKISFFFNGWVVSHCVCGCVCVCVCVYVCVFNSHFICSVVSDSLWPHELQHARPPCPSLTPAVYSNSCPSSQWCHPAISSSVVPFSSCPQSLPASGSFPMCVCIGEWIKKKWFIYISFLSIHLLMDT